MNPADLDKLEGYNPKRLKSLVQKWPDQMQANQAWALYKLNPSWVSWGDLSRNWYITCPKVSLPCWKYIFSRVFVHFSASSLGLFGIYPPSLPKSAGYILGELQWFLHLMLSYLSNPSMFIYCWSSHFVEKKCVEKGAGRLRCHLVHPTWYGGWIWANYHESSFDL